jgi:hypothetical protein
MDLTKEEILEGNKLIAEFMGGEFKEDLPYTFAKSGWLKTPANDHQTIAQDYDFRYHKSWDWLMPVIEKINGLGKEYSFSIFKTYIALSVEKGGRVFKDFSFAHSENITSTQTSKQAAFKLVVKFVKWQNEKNLAQNLEVTK